MTRRRRSGHSAVETALIMPMTVFIILGILQLGLMMHARYAAQYAAWSAARAASVHDGDCRAALTGALLAVAPAVGRTYNATDFLAVWNQAGTDVSPFRPARVALKDNLYGGVAQLPVITAKMVASDPATPNFNNGEDADFDRVGQPIMVTWEVIFNYELRIPFANAVIHESWTLANYFAKNSLVLPQDRADHARGDLAPYVISARQDRRYVIKIPATATMRMMSNPTTGLWSAAQQGCSGPAYDGSAL